MTRQEINAALNVQRADGQTPLFHVCGTFNGRRFQSDSRSPTLAQSAEAIRIMARDSRYTLDSIEPAELSQEDIVGSMASFYRGGADRAFAND